ncbi:hypothetical protein CH063_02384 [Colletotrichum higginsianum]|uniref:Uncharacterized protein n=2 Tax=Colletotrichum higginsianum TaxID=80884 RepID=H1VK13_COLHI|nr:hypothetical protein CH63R_08583 [Colletotrichum higginsianum IMI 349063]OBR07062.1 hypothetical protein CH63R_08583 [Colletotrichum higginsianum IMI 349063]TIC92361.1 hypothetical protein CH35J_010068 [Colletotrichum higginsianum]GJC98815.1 hypothetical protein ColKHC_07641 [Colletotrichum higginsianum]CCF40566.1 hypothetical protein CH063_02384 [Colletotrichum higginsianum]
MITWIGNINFVSALLLHSCLTVLIKEAINLVSVVLFLAPFRCFEQPKPPIAAGSLILDDYTYVLSNDNDSDLAELYFTR